MTREKYLAFLNKLLVATKEGKITWRHNPFRNFPNDVKTIVPLKCYVSDIGSGLKVYLDYCSDDFIVFSYSYDLFEGCFVDENDIEAISLVTRLYDYVCSKNPDAEKVIDDFLNSF